MRYALSSIFVAYCAFFSSLFNKTLFLKRINSRKSDREKNLHRRQTKTVLLIDDYLHISSSIFNLLIFFFPFVFTWGTMMTIESFSSHKTTHICIHIQMSDCFSFSSFKRNEWAGSLLLRRTLKYVCTRRLTSMGCQVHNILSFLSLSLSTLFFFFIVQIVKM